MVLGDPHGKKIIRPQRSHHCYSQDLAFRSIQQFFCTMHNRQANIREKTSKSKQATGEKKLMVVADPLATSVLHTQELQTIQCWGVAAAYVFLQLTWLRESQQNLVGVFCGAANEVVH